MRAFLCCASVIVLTLVSFIADGKVLRRKPCDMMELRRKIGESCMHSRRSPYISEDLLRNYYELEERVPLSREIAIVVIEPESPEKIRRRRIREMSLLHKCCTIGCTAEDFKGACD